MKSCVVFWGVRLFAFAIAANSLVARAQSVTVSNPSFEVDGISGAGPISGWTSDDDSKVAISALPSVPFNGVHFDGAQVAVLRQGGMISQTITGLDPSRLYVLYTAFFNNSTNGGLLNTSFGTRSLGGSGGGNLTLDRFQPTSTTDVLKYTYQGNDQNYLDAVAIRIQPANEASLIFDPSFEGSVSADSMGYSSVIAGWITSGSTGVASSSGSQSAFADNGAIPDGSKVAFLKANGGTAASLSSQMSMGGYGTGSISAALVAGKTYHLTFRYNASSADGSLDPADMTVQVDSKTVANGVVVTPVGGLSDYYTFDATFTASASLRAPALTISNSDSGGSKGSSILLIDDLSIQQVVPEPGTIVAVALVGFFTKRRSLSCRRC